MNTNHVETDLFLHGNKIHKNIDIEILKAIQLGKDIDFSDPELEVDYSKDFLDEIHDFKDKDKDFSENLDYVKAELLKKVSKTGDEDISGVKTILNDMIFKEETELQSVQLLSGNTTDISESTNWETGLPTEHDLTFSIDLIVSEASILIMNNFIESFIGQSDWTVSQNGVDSNQNWNPSDTTKVFLKINYNGTDYLYKFYGLSIRNASVYFYGVFVENSGNFDKAISLETIFGVGNNTPLISIKSEKLIILEHPGIKNLPEPVLDNDPVILKTIKAQFNINEKETQKLTSDFILQSKADLYYYPSNMINSLTPYKGIKNGDIINILLHERDDYGWTPNLFPNKPFKKYSVDNNGGQFKIVGGYLGKNSKIEFNSNLNFPLIEGGLYPLPYEVNFGGQVTNLVPGKEFYDLIKATYKDNQIEYLNTFDNSKFLAQIRSTENNNDILLFVFYDNINPGILIEVDRIPYKNGTTVLKSNNFFSFYFINDTGVIYYFQSNGVFSKVVLEGAHNTTIEGFQSIIIPTTGMLENLTFIDNNMFFIAPNSVTNNQEIIQCSINPWDSSFSFAKYEQHLYANNPIYNCSYINSLSDSGNLNVIYNIKGTPDYVFAYQDENQVIKNISITGFIDCYHIGYYLLLQSHQDYGKVIVSYDIKNNKFLYYGNENNFYFTPLLLQSFGYVGEITDTNYYKVKSLIPTALPEVIKSDFNKTLVKLRYVFDETNEYSTIGNNKIYYGPYWEILQCDSLDKVIKSDDLYFVNKLIDKKLFESKPEEFFNTRKNDSTKNSKTKLTLNDDFVLSNKNIDGISSKTEILSPLLYDNNAFITMTNILYSSKLDQNSPIYWRTPLITDVQNLINVLYKENIDQNFNEFRSINNFWLTLNKDYLNIRKDTGEFDMAENGSYYCWIDDNSGTHMYIMVSSVQQDYLTDFPSIVKVSDFIYKLPLTAIDEVNKLKKFGLKIRVVRSLSKEELDKNYADGTIIDSYTGQNGFKYDGVKIGSCVWLKTCLIETLFHNNNGFTVTNIKLNEEWIADSPNAKYCAYNNNFKTILNVESNNIPKPIQLSGASVLNYNIKSENVVKCNIKPLLGLLYPIWPLYHFKENFSVDTYAPCNPLFVSSPEWRVADNYDYNTMFNYMQPDNNKDILGKKLKSKKYVNRLFLTQENFSTFFEYDKCGSDLVGFDLLTNTIFAKPSLTQPISTNPKTTRFYFGTYFSESLNTFQSDGITLRLCRDANPDELLLEDGTRCADYIGNNGIVYPTTKIGTQVWLKNNICETILRDGTPIYHKLYYWTDQSVNLGFHASYIDKSEKIIAETENSLTSGYLSKTNNPDLIMPKDNKSLVLSNIKDYKLTIKHGYLYNYDTIKLFSKITSDDLWRVPNSSDWDNLVVYGGGAIEILSKLKAKTDWVTPGTDIFNFTILPSGCYRNDTFVTLNEEAYFWIDGEEVTTPNVKRITNTVFTSEPVSRTNALSVRLVRDASSEEELLTDGTKCKPYIGNDKKVYETIKIGQQVWLASNLIETKFRNNTDILEFGVIPGNTSGYKTPIYYRSYDDNQENAYSEKIESIDLKKYAVKEELDIDILDLATYDGIKHIIDLSVPKFYTLDIPNGTTDLNFGLFFPEDANKKMREVIVLIDNSNNASTIATVNFGTGDLGNHVWKWSAGDPILGLAPGAKCELSVRNRSNTVVKAITDTES